jgi:competence protein ComEC
MNNRTALFALLLGLTAAPALASTQPPAPPPAPEAAAAPGPPAVGTYIVHAIDVGTGLSIFVEGNDFALLYDAGSREDFGGGRENRVLAYLRRIRPDLRRLDHVILSHPHQDHHEMMDSVLDTYEVGHVWDSGSVATSCGYRAFLDAVLAEPGVVYHNAAGGPGTHSVRFAAARSCHGRSRPAATLAIPLGGQLSRGLQVALGAGARMTFLRADPHAPPGDLNEATVVARLDLGTRRVLLAGDAEAGGRLAPSTPPSPGSAEGELLACCASGLAADILVVAHHGSMSSSRTAFLDAVRAQHFVISSGPYKYGSNRIVLPDAAVVTELRRRGTVWRTDDDDRACARNPRKIGRDNDGRPGGCDNVRIVIAPTGTVSPAYNRIAD